MLHAFDATPTMTVGLARLPLELVECVAGYVSLAEIYFYCCVTLDVGLRAVRQTGTVVTKTIVRSDLEISDGWDPAITPVTAVDGFKPHIVYILSVY